MKFNILFILLSGVFISLGFVKSFADHDEDKRFFKSQMSRCGSSISCAGGVILDAMFYLASDNPTPSPDTKVTVSLYGDGGWNTKLDYCDRNRSSRGPLIFKIELSTNDLDGNNQKCERLEELSLKNLHTVEWNDRCVGNRSIHGLSAVEGCKRAAREIDISNGL